MENRIDFVKDFCQRIVDCVDLQYVSSCKHNIEALQNMQFDELQG